MFSAFNFNVSYKSVLRIVCLLVGIIALVAVSIYYTPTLAKHMKDPIEFGEYIRSFGTSSILIFIGFQIVQVVIAALPGEVTQVAGGFVYGTFLGTVFSYIGITIGMVIVLFFVRVFGMPVVKICLSEKQMGKFKFLVNRPNAELLIVVLFIIPGIPKDILTYLAGLSPLNPIRFLFFASLARVPGIFLSSYIGAHLEKQQYFEAIIASTVAALLLALGLLFKEKIQRMIIKRFD